MSLKKVQIQLLNEETGDVIEDVTPLTEAGSVVFADGETFQEKLDSGKLKGQKGDTGATGATGPKGEKGDTGATGQQGAKGDKGDPFAIAKTYASISAMNAGFATDGVKEGQFVMIDTGNVEDEDNAKLYVKGSASYTYITDLSGATGLTGPQGPQGEKGATGAQGAKGDKGDKGDQGPAGKDGDNVRVGTQYDTATQVKLFFKVVE